MSSRRAFLRKITYLVILALLMVPLSWMSRPPTIGGAGSPGSAGGKLAQLRHDYQLSQANLGEIDPASEAIKLATLGMRGVATNILWTKVNRYKKEEDWTAMSATLRQITKLQPNFVDVWRHQAWNLSYNVSVEWDDYRDRYYWVIQGINFLREGERYNQNEPLLLWDLGWFISNKIGRADEHREFRQLFKEDDDFHGDLPVAQRDNWLVGKREFERSQAVVDRGLRPLRGMAPHIFHSHPSLCQTHYASALAEEGIFDELGRVAWQQASADWDQFGNREFRLDTGERVRMNDLDEYVEAARAAYLRLDALAPGVRMAIREERIAALSPEERQLLLTPREELLVEQFEALHNLQYKLYVGHREVAERLPQSEREEGRRLALEAEAADELVRRVESYRNTVNYPYWVVRCRAEQTADAMEAHRQIYLGQRAFREADLQTARDAYEAAFRAWYRVLEQYPPLAVDSITGEEIVEVVRQYREILDRLDEPLPDDFPLGPLVEYFEPIMMPQPNAGAGS